MAMEIVDLPRKIVISQSYVSLRYPNCRVYFMENPIYKWMSFPGLALVIIHFSLGFSIIALVIIHCSWGFSIINQAFLELPLF